MVNINERFFDREIMHQIFVDDYKSNLNEDIDRMAPEWGAATNFKNKKSWSGVLAKRFTRIRDAVMTGREDFLRDELDFQTKTLKTNWYDPARPSIKNIQNHINSPGISKRLLPKELDLIKRNELARTSARLRQGISQGASRRQLLKIANKSSVITQNQAKTLVNTEITRASSIIKREVANVNTDLVDGLLFTAVLDFNTTNTCRANHNRVVKPHQVQFQPPLHFGCRSTLVPQTFNRDRLIENGLLPPDDIQTGFVSDDNADKWFSRQTFKNKVRILGTEERVAFWENGLPLGQLLTRGGSTRSIGRFAGICRWLLHCCHLKNVS